MMPIKNLAREWIGIISKTTKMSKKGDVERYMLLFVILIILVIIIIGLYYGAIVKFIQEFLAQRPR